MVSMILNLRFVLSLTSDPETGLEGWNAVSLWRNEYQDLATGLLFFAEDVLQDQFCLSMKENLRELGGLARAALVLTSS
jgi:hypothetical protein